MVTEVVIGGSQSVIDGGECGGWWWRK